MAKKKSGEPGGAAKKSGGTGAAGKSKTDAGGASTRTAWLDPTSETTVIDDYAQRLGSFMAAMADGRIDASEVKDQEARVVELMKSVEPELDDALHERVTQLLCELSAFNIMQTLHQLMESQPARTKFRG